MDRSLELGHRQNGCSFMAAGWLWVNGEQCFPTTVRGAWLQFAAGVGDLGFVHKVVAPLQ